MPRSRAARRTSLAARCTLEQLDVRRMLSGTPFLGEAYHADVAIPAHHYDLGGQGVAFRESDARDHGGNNTRGDGVDVQIRGNRTVVGWAQHDEWLEYTVKLAEGGRYELTAIASTAFYGSSLNFSVDGVHKGSAAIAMNGWGGFGEASAGEVELSAGTHVVRVTFRRSPGGDVGDLASIKLKRAGGLVEQPTPTNPQPGPAPVDGPQSPYGRSPARPGVIEAEHYDEGGEGIAFHETDANDRGGANARGDGVDMSVRGGRTNVGWNVSGEWLEYTIDVDQAGRFDLSALAATGMDNARLRFSIDGQSVGSAVVPMVDWMSYRDVRVGSVELSAGRHVVRVTFDRPGGGYVADFDKWSLTRTLVETPTTPTPVPPPTTSAQSPFNGTAWALPGTIEFEHFDGGGEGVAFGESDARDNGGANTRGNGVDIARRGDRTIVGWAKNGEWLEYTVEVETAGRYDLKAIASTGNWGSSLRFDVDGGHAATVGIPANGWGQWSTLAVGTLELSAGTHVLRATFLNTGGGDAGDFDKFTLSQIGTVTPPPPITQPPANGSQIASSSWTAERGFPRGIMEGVTVTVGDETFIWGGYFDTTWAIAKDGYAYSHATGHWRRIADLPVAFSHQASVTHDGKIYFFGGFTGEYGARDTTVGDQSWVYDPATNRFSEFVRLPYKVSAQGAVVVGNRVHLLSGMERHNGGEFIRNLDRHVSLDLDDPSAGWREEAATPIARDHLAAVNVGGKLYLFGGQIDDDQWAGARGESYVYDPQAKTWAQLPNMPDPRGHINGSVVVWKDRYVVIVAGNGLGGRWDTSPTDSVYAYDTVAKTWTTLRDLPARRFGTHAFLVGDTLHALGGGYGRAQSDHWSTTLSLG